MMNNFSILPLELVIQIIEAVIAESPMAIVTVSLISRDFRELMNWYIQAVLKMKEERSIERVSYLTVSGIKVGWEILSKDGVVSNIYYNWGIISRNFVFNTRTKIGMNLYYEREVLVKKESYSRIDPEQVILRRITYENGKPAEEKEYENGKLVIEGVYVNGQLRERHVYTQNDRKVYVWDEKRATLCYQTTLALT